MTMGGKKECMVCCQCWHSRQRRSIITKGKCPGAPVWEPGPLPEIPWILPKGSQLIHGSKIVHKSHRLAYKRGLLICLRCGALSHGTRIINLSEECFGKPRSQWALGCFKNFRADRHPNGTRGRWPKRRRDPIPEVYREIV